MKDGILVVNKPEGLSSANVVGRLKRVLGVKKIGHTGTLDPFATGVLLLAVGQATRISRFFLGGSKRYLAQVTLGVETDTYDCTGKSVNTASMEELDGLEFDTIQKAVQEFQGLQQQVAPAFSALKHKGVPLYKLARQGQIVHKPPRQVEIHHIEAMNPGFSPEGLPRFDLDVHCSGGTYIRSLAFDLGRELGCGAHLSGLVRTRSSQFDIKDAIDLESAHTLPLEKLEERIIPMSRCLESLPKVVADRQLAGKISHGQKIGHSEISGIEMEARPEDEVFIRVVDENENLLAIIQPGSQPGKKDLPYNYCCVFNR